MENFENGKSTKRMKKPAKQKSLLTENDIIPSLANIDLQGKRPDILDHIIDARNTLKREKSFKHVPSVSYDSCQNILPERQSSEKEENKPSKDPRINKWFETISILKPKIFFLIKPTIMYTSMQV